MEPVTTVTTAWTIAKTAGEITKKLFEIQKSLKDHDAKQAGGPEVAEGFEVRVPCPRRSEGGAFV